MSAACSVRIAHRGDRDALSGLRARLWPEVDPREHGLEFDALLGQPERFALFIATAHAGDAIGFAEASVRVDYVNGTEGSPVGFLEGLYVAPAARRRGVGGALVVAAEHWVRARGCAEFASDVLLANAASHAAHLAWGFEETERVVYFRKRVGPERT